jgi:chromate transporter
LAAVNAAVIGLLLAAFYQPVWQTAIINTLDLVIAVLAFIGLMFWRLPVLLVVVMCAFAGLVIN